MMMIKMDDDNADADVDVDTDDDVMIMSMSMSTIDGGCYLGRGTMSNTSRSDVAECS
jgi:hypothetical protein